MLTLPSPRPACHDRGRTDYVWYNDCLLVRTSNTSGRSFTNGTSRIDFGLYFTDPKQVSFRFPLAFQIFFCLPILFFVLSLPESPRWLILKGRDEEAMVVLAALNGVPQEHELVQSEFQAIADTVIEASKGSFADLFTMGEYRHFHRVVLAYVNQMFQQISGERLDLFLLTKLTFQALTSSPTTFPMCWKMKLVCQLSTPSSSPPATEQNTLWPRGSLFSPSRRLDVAS